MVGSVKKQGESRLRSESVDKTIKGGLAEALVPRIHGKIYKDVIYPPVTHNNITELRGDPHLHGIIEDHIKQKYERIERTEWLNVKMVYSNSGFALGQVFGEARNPTDEKDSQRKEMWKSEPDIFRWVTVLV